MPLYDGAALARRGVVVVTLNDRLGVLNFLAHVALSREAQGKTLGNYGIMDQIAALRWVRNDIAGSQGDARYVTVFAKSAGTTAEPKRLRPTRSSAHDPRHGYR